MLRFTIDGEKYEFNPRRLMNVEAIAIKQATNLTLQGWNDAISQADPVAITAMVWIVRKREDPTVQFADVEFNLMEFLESLESDEEPDAEGDPTDSTTTPGPSSPHSPTTSESESGSSLS